MSTSNKNWIVTVLTMLCLTLPAGATGNQSRDTDSDYDWLQSLLERPPTSSEELIVYGAVLGATIGSYCAYEVLVPFDWMDVGTVSKRIGNWSSASTGGEGSIWPFGIGLDFTDAQFPGVNS